MLLCGWVLRGPGTWSSEFKRKCFHPSSLGDSKVILFDLGNMTPIVPGCDLVLRGQGLKIVASFFKGACYPLFGFEGC